MASVFEEEGGNRRAIIQGPLDKKAATKKTKGQNHQAVVDMVGGWSLAREARAILHAAAHISGGGIPEKLGRALKPSGLGAFLDDPFKPSELMLYCQEVGVSDREAYKAWNMGQGMILITPSYQEVITVTTDYSI